MYATINLPGSRHFEYYGPASKEACEKWLERRVTELQETELSSSLLPQSIHANREIESWKYRDGSSVVRPGAESY